MSWNPRLKAEDLTPVYDWKVFVAKLLGEDPRIAIDDGWFICFFCESEGAWDRDGVDHEEGCIWIEARYALLIDGTGDENCCQECGHPAPEHYAWATECMHADGQADG